MKVLMCMDVVDYILFILECQRYFYCWILQVVSVYCSVQFVTEVGKKPSSGPFASCEGVQSIVSWPGRKHFCHLFSTHCCCSETDDFSIVIFKTFTYITAYCV